MEYFYDSQLRRYLTQFMRVMSNFAYKDGNGNIIQIPVRYGDMNRQVAQIIKKNSENTVPSAPFIACYIKGLEYARKRVSDPTFVGKKHIRERALNDEGDEYLNEQGANYTVERLMPVPFDIKFAADIWTSNTDQKFQLIEQIVVLFNPSMEIQTSNNYIDWTSLSLLELENLNFSSRQVPQGLEQDIDICTMTFNSPAWITTPAKVKKLGIVTKIITSIYTELEGTAASEQPLVEGEIMGIYAGRTPVSVEVTTLGNLGILILNNTAKLVSPKDFHTDLNNVPLNPPINFGPNVNWNSILDRYPGQFIAGLSSIRLMKPDGTEIVGFISLNPSDDTTMQVNWDTDTIYMNTLLTDLNGNLPRGTIDAIINPQTFNPRPTLPNASLGWPATDTRYLIMEDITEDTIAWQNQDSTYFTASANDIIQWDGAKWNIIFNAITSTSLIYITNARTGIQYAWNGTAWLKSYEGIYDPSTWRLVL
jgi:hypothetical protein